MQEHDLQVLRGAAVPTAVAGLALMGIGAAVAGGKGALGAALAVVVVAAFFGIGAAVLGSLGRMHPMAMLNIAILTYLVKVLALFGVLVAFRDATWFDRPVFGISIAVAALVWIAGEVRAFTKLKILYVEPGQEP